MHVGANGHQIDVQLNYFNPKAFVSVASFFSLLNIIFYAYSKILADILYSTNGTYKINTNNPNRGHLLCWALENKMRFFISF